MNLQIILKDVIPEHWLEGSTTLPSFVIHDEFYSQEKILEKKLKETQSDEETKDIRVKQENLATKKEKWLNYSQN